MWTQPLPEDWAYIHSLYIYLCGCSYLYEGGGGRLTARGAAAAMQPPHSLSSWPGQVRGHAGHTEWVSLFKLPVKESRILDFDWGLFFCLSELFFGIWKWNNAIIQNLYLLPCSKLRQKHFNSTDVPYEPYVL
jgi:hypothetical protein